MQAEVQEALLQENGEQECSMTSSPAILAPLARRLYPASLSYLSPLPVTIIQHVGVSVRADASTTVLNQSYCIPDFRVHEVLTHFSLTSTQQPRIP